MMCQFILGNINFTDASPGHGNAVRDHALWIATDEWMPVREAFTGGEQTVGATVRQCAEVVLDGIGREHDTVRHLLFAVRVIPALAGVRVEQAAGNIREVYLAAFDIFELVQAAAATAIAQAFPFGLVQFGKWFVLPERHGLLGTQGFYRVEPGGAARGNEPGSEADQQRDGFGEDDIRQRDMYGQGRQQQVE